MYFFSPWQVGRKWNLASERTLATTGKEGKWNSCTFEEEKIQPMHIEWLFANSALKVQKKVCAHLWWLHTKASLFHLWHRCVLTQPCVRQWVRCDVVGTVVPCAGSDYSLHVPTTPQPSPPSQHFTEQSKHGGQIRNRPYVLSAYSRIPAVGESHVWWGV